MARRTFGLDFGTTNSLVSIVQGDKVIALVDQDNSRPHPSVVWYRGTEVIVGKRAREHLDSREGSPPLGLLRSPKMTLRRQGPVHLDGKEYAPSDVVAEVLKHLRADARVPRADGNPHDLDRAVMTIPVDFEGPQRRDLRAAARKAGIGVVQFVHEPVAALYAYLRSQPDYKRAVAELENRVLLVFDWGGGTLDLTLCRVLGGTLMQIKSVGDNEIGGDRFDERLMNLSRTAYGERHGIDDIRAVEAPGMGAKLLVQCENAKIAISGGRESYPAFVREYARAGGQARHLNITITRADMERESDSLVRRGLGTIDSLLEDAGLTHADVEFCLPTGGMVNMPAIRNGLVERFGRRVPKLPNGDRIISEGAAWIANDQLRLTLAKPVEVRVADGSGSGHYHAIIPKGFQLPVENEERGAGGHDFMCADPRGGVAVFEFAKPKSVGLVGPEAERETLCEVSVPVNPRSKPLFERLTCEVRIDHDYIAHVHVSSLGRGMASAGEFHRLDFGLALLGRNDLAPKDQKGDPNADAKVPAGSARIRGTEGAVARRPNVLSARERNPKLVVAGDLAAKEWPNMFNPDHPQATPRQFQEMLYYIPCVFCRRTLYQIENEGLIARCILGTCDGGKSGRKAFDRWA
jgi:hypothetical protein